MAEPSLNNSTKDLWISWDEYHRAIELLALKIHDSAWEFDHILCLARGGLRIGDVLSRLFNLPLSIISTSSYRENGGTVREDLTIGAHVSQLSEDLSGRVLIVDDLVDTGLSLIKVEQWLRSEFPTVTETKTAVIWYKSGSQARPDFYMQYLENNPWIRQPFEQYDDMSMLELKEHLRSERT
ncbi:MAG: phosphoribosyltransferase [Undibacterium sp.]|nr:phosphoribosyltransferase [Undibacterium sp.]